MRRSKIALGRERKKFCQAEWSILTGCLLALAGCMTPEKAVRQTDETALQLATACWQDQTGATNLFDMTRAADTLTLRIALLAVSRGEQHVVFPKIPHIESLNVTNGVVTLSLSNALCLAARNDRQYQKLKEAVFTSALDLDYQQYQFDTTFSGIMLGVLTGDPSIEKARGQATAGFDRKMENGLEVAGQLAVNVVSLLRDDWRSMGLTGDLTMTVPLMRGSGRDIIREPLTQAERNLMYAILSFERYRQSYAVETATEFFDVLEYNQRLRNALDNERRLEENSRRAEMMFKAGRMQRIQVDQARSDLLNAGEGVISTRRTLESKLDAFKIQIGLPPEAHLALDEHELDRLTQQMEVWAKTSDSAIDAFPDEAEACRIALAHRHDLAVIRGVVEDAARAVQIAADALRADVSLTGGLSMDRLRETGDGSFHGGEAFEGGVRSSMPWNRRRERNTFKKRLIELEQAKRALEEKEDLVKQSVRNGFRLLLASRASYDNRQETMKVAKLRVESNNLFLQSGRSSMRDILEAESSLLSARNALCSAVIQWRLSDLALRRDLGVLEILENGTWHERSTGENHG